MSEAIVPKEREITSQGNFIEMAAWKVPVTKHYPEGVKYSFALIKEGKRIIGIDNHNREGHHRHFFDTKKPYDFESLKKVKEDFRTMIEKFENENSKYKDKN